MTKKSKHQAAAQDYLPYRKKMHHFADQYLSSKGLTRPFMPMAVDKTMFEDFVNFANIDFRNRYSKRWAQLMHDEKRIAMMKRF